jgi:predicted nucleic acid-binding protein
MADRPVTAPEDRIVLDNSVISTFHDARVLSTLLELWPGRWLVPLEVQGEAAAWPAQGAAVSTILQQLHAQQVIEVTAVDPRVEGPLFAQLTRRLGQGESAVIAIAANRGHIAALDDRRARRACDQLSPPVRWVATEEILGFAVSDGLLTRAEAEAIWQATGILDPRRRLP